MVTLYLKYATTTSTPVPPSTCRPPPRCRRPRPARPVTPSRTRPRQVGWLALARLVSASPASGLAGPVGARSARARHPGGLSQVSPRRRRRGLSCSSGPKQRTGTPAPHLYAADRRYLTPAVSHSSGLRLAGPAASIAACAAAPHRRAPRPRLDGEGAVACLFSAGRSVRLVQQQILDLGESR
jgi:hypothetical protein